MHRWIALVLLLATFVPELPAQTGSPAVEIRRVLEQQQAAWNRGDLEGFMRGYWNSAALTFVSGTKVTRGWQPTLDRYRRTYQQNGAEMGKLEFSELEIQPLGTGAALVSGAFRLAMSSGKHPHGRFTLVFRRFAPGWRIVHDHTCSTE